MKGVEVLYMIDPLDEQVAHELKEFDGKQFKSNTKERLEEQAEHEAAPTPTEKKMRQRGTQKRRRIGSNERRRRKIELVLDAEDPPPAEEVPAADVPPTAERVPAAEDPPPADESAKLLAEAQLKARKRDWSP